jgi:hypothetical protein
MFVHVKNVNCVHCSYVLGVAKEKHFMHEYR